ncbi:D-alanyl-D-alanine carboxypeptidase family protein [Chromohalobacter nigrandesensis]|uniref:D-alanyl-D-alanine carboxypeptidase family protein n=1 Tax=Chromohalobacter nigrandesensis TaxID=119863 RepID=UPI001FF11C48|nr:D-alanyl-D-alanine carboxypeptidase family protein [Chromohalobacter nigrandesensis]MCK0745907.1 D-alanyl-D-alanine carboxypeptidase [Chromohalobacter nigrandesensis]
MTSPLSHHHARALPVLLTLIVFVMALCMLPAAQAAPNPRYASIVIDTESGAVLHAANADATRYPASLTKMMTLYLLFEALEDDSLSMESRLPVSTYAASKPPSKMGVKPGETVKVEDAINILVVKSANDVAAVVAEGLAGSESTFAGQMTDKARALGMAHTTFRNASGLPDDRQVTTARDMAILALRLMQDFPSYYPIFAKTEFTWHGKRYQGHNRLLDNYAGTDGLKTGYIRASGFNVATSAVHDGRRLLSVVMGGFTAQSRDAHMSELLDRGFARAESVAHGDWIAEADIYGDSLQATPTSDSAPTPADDPIRDLIAQAEYEDGDAGGARSAVANGAWAVQVGAFSDRTRARRQAAQAADFLPADLDGRVAVSPVQGDGGVFRAQLVDLEETQARRGCRQLAREGVDCVVVAMGAGQ